MNFSTSDASFNFTVNGKYLDGASTNSSAAMANAISANFGTDVSSLQNKLNTLMTTLNGVHPESVFEYSIDEAAKAITLRQRDGGEILLGGFVTASTHKDLTASVDAIWSRNKPDINLSKITIKQRRQLLLGRKE